MIPEFLERENLNKPVEGILKELDEVLKEYVKEIGEDNITTAVCNDYEHLIQQIKECIELKISYHILYEDDDVEDEKVLY